MLQRSANGDDDGGGGSPRTSAINSVSMPRVARRT